MARLTDDWTDDELVREIRRRERRAGSGDRSRAASRAPGRSSALAEVPTADLVRAAKVRQRGIYGSDNRQDMYLVTRPALRRSADAVVALVKASDLSEHADGTFELTTESYGDAYGLCGSEPFVSQPTGCFCSGFLVGPDVVATAGHCVKNAADLRTMRFVFGFRMTNAATARTRFAAADVYAGRQLLGRQLSSDGTDWALVRLDRPAIGRKAVSIRTTGKVKDTQAVYVIGHPCGLPQKFAADARVRENGAATFFVANLDTYGGNSGSPVFNQQTNKVEGILVRGETDFVSNGQCDVSLVCPSTGCRGEDVTRATVWSARVPKATRAKGPGRAGAKRTTRKASRK